MTEPIYVKYHPGEDPIEVLEAARRQHGQDVKIIAVPISLFKRWKLGEARTQRSYLEQIDTYKTFQGKSNHLTEGV